jgi:cell division protein ZipA
MNALPFTLSPLQWAVLIFGVIAIVVVIVMTRREKGVKPDRRGARVIAQPRVELPETYGIAGEFDEFGVGRPRKHGEQRVPPKVPMPQLRIDQTPLRSAERRPSATPPSFLQQGDRTRAPEKPSRPVAPSMAQEAPRVAPQTPLPLAPATPQQVPTEAPAAAAPQRAVEEKITKLLVARHDSGSIPGKSIHEALVAEGLIYGELQIYHRHHDGKRVFSVSNLRAPGVLIPEEAASLSTAGLQIFLQLPGPREPVAAFEDMLYTAQRLAERLNADVYDGRAQPLTTQTLKALRTEIKAWAAGASAAQ